MWKEFKEFNFTGNVIDFAIAVILAGAVGLVVTGFVEDIVMPIVGHFSGGVDFADMMTPLGDGVNEDGSPENAVRWGKWINSIINLITVGFVLFMLAKAKIKFMGAAPDPGPTADQSLLAEIRDAVRK